jgi:hypothetical protein
MREARTEPDKRARITARDCTAFIHSDVWLSIIFNPMNTRAAESPKCKKRNRSMHPARAKYIARSPKIARAFDVSKMNVSRVTPNTAGMESTAKIRSVASMINNMMNKGVTKIPSFSRIKKELLLKLERIVLPTFPPEKRMNVRSAAQACVFPLLSAPRRKDK